MKILTHFLSSLFPNNSIPDAFSVMVLNRFRIETRLISFVYCSPHQLLYSQIRNTNTLAHTHTHTNTPVAVIVTWNAVCCVVILCVCACGWGKIWEKQSIVNNWTVCSPCVFSLFLCIMCNNVCVNVFPCTKILSRMFAPGRRRRKASRNYN